MAVAVVEVRCIAVRDRRAGELTMLVCERGRACVIERAAW